MREAHASGATFDADADAEDSALAEYRRTSAIMTKLPVTRHPSERAPLVIPERPPVFNPSVRYLVAMPAMWVAVNALLGVWGGLWWWVLAVTLVLAAAASVVLARDDQRQLVADGHVDTVSPWRAVIPIVYLIGRGNIVYRANSAGYRPLWVHLSVIGGLVFAAFLLTLLSGAIIKVADAWAYYGL